MNHLKLLVFLLWSGVSSSLFSACGYCMREYPSGIDLQIHFQTCNVHMKQFQKGLDKRLSDGEETKVESTYQKKMEGVSKLKLQSYSKVQWQPVSEQIIWHQDWIQWNQGWILWNSNSRQTQQARLKWFQGAMEPCAPPGCLVVIEQYIALREVAIKRHESSIQVHKKMLQDLIKAPSSGKAPRREKGRKKDRLEGNPYLCKDCNIPLTSQWSLDRYYDSAAHRAGSRVSFLH